MKGANNKGNHGLKAQTHKLLLAFFLFVGLSFHASSQVGDQTLTKVGGWNAYVHLPSDYAANPTAKYPIIIFIAGIGEIGTDPSKMLIYGPGYYIKQGNNMEFTVNGKLEKPIVLSLQPINGWPIASLINTQLDSVMSRWRIDPSRLYLTGLSMGGWAWDNYVCGTQYYAYRPAAIVSMSSPPPNEPMDSMAAYARFGGKWWGFEGSTDYRKLNLRRDIMNAAVPGSARYTAYIGGHCCWNTWYNPTWKENGVSIYEWMLSQSRKFPDASVPNALPIVSAGRDTIVVQPSTSVNLMAKGSDADGFMVGYKWTKLSGPTAGTVENINLQNTRAINLTVGLYKFEVAATDNRLATIKDTVEIIVNPTGIANDCGCDKIISKPASGGVSVKYAAGEVKPGDKICIMAGRYDWISFEGVVGTAEKPVTIVNCGGQVSTGAGTTIAYGFRMIKSRFFKVTGTGFPGLEYGIKIDGGTRNVPNGIAMADSIGDLEIDHVEITKSEAGFMIKTNPTNCQPGTWGQNWEMKNISIHDCYVHNVVGEGFYIGHTSFSVTVNDCAGLPIVVQTQMMRNVKIYNNLLDTLGWDGIQVANTPEGVEIYNNVIKNFGTVNQAGQQAGIIFGGKCNGKVYNNTIIKGTGSGLQVFGSGLSYFYNNLIVNTGISNQDAVFMDDRPAPGYPGLKVMFVNNTVVKSGRDAIRLSNSTGTVAPGSQFVNNLVVAPGTLGKNSTPYLVISTTSGGTQNNNVFLPTLAVAGFIDTLNNNFNLLSTSPAINAGVATGSFGFNTDQVGIQKPSGAGVEVGAYELLDNNLLPPLASTTNADYSTLNTCIPINGTGWNTMYDQNYLPVFEVQKNGQNLNNLCWSRRIVTSKVRSYNSYFGQPALQRGAFMKRNFLLDAKAVQLSGNVKVRFIVTTAELEEFIAAYNTANGTSCTINELQVVRYDGSNNDLDFGNNLLNNTKFTSYQAIVSTYGANGSLKYIEISTSAFGEFWIGLTCEGNNTNISQQSASNLVVPSGIASVQGWYRADNLQASGGTISKANTLIDLSGNSRHAVQANATYQPVVVTKSNVLNNQPALQFDNNVMDIPFNGTSVQSPFLTVYAVASHRTGNLLSKVWGQDVGDYSRGAGLHNINGNNRLSYLAGGSVREITTTAANKPFMVKTKYSNTSFSGAVNGIAGPTDTAISNGNGKQVISIGNITSLQSSPQYFEWWDGQIAEVLVFNSLLSNAQEVLLENYLSARYNLPLAVDRNKYLMDDTSNGNYDHDVIGIGMASDMSAVLQSTGLDSITIVNPSDVQPDEWLLIGHNGKSIGDSTSGLLPEGISKRSKKEWRVSKQGDLGTVDIEIDLSGITYISTDSTNVSLLKDVHNDGSFANETQAAGGIVTGEWTANGKVIFRNVSLSSSQRFTIGFGTTLAVPSTVYLFNGTGNFSNPANWLNGQVPTTEIAGKNEIIISPSTGDCILDVPFTLKTGMKLTVVAGKNFIVR